MNSSGYAFYVLPAILGFAVVLQSGMNRKIAGLYTLPIATLLNCLILTSLGVGVYWLSRRLSTGESGETFVRALSKFQWWYVVPGACGFALITGLPYSVSRIGAMKTFLVFLVAQIIFSLLWDAYFEGYVISTAKILGMAIALLGVVVVILSK